MDRIWWAAIGLMALAACRREPGYAFGAQDAGRGVGEDAEFVHLDAGGSCGRACDSGPAPLDGASWTWPVDAASADGGSGLDGTTSGVDTGGAQDAAPGTGHDDAAASADSGSLPDFGPGADTGVGPNPDSGAPADAGMISGTGDIWVEIDYSNASTPTSPSWSFSATPGWGPAQWATSGTTYPEAWDRFNNMQVTSDPIGTVLEIGPGSQLQLMIGLTSLIGYQSATVHLEGRSRSTDAPVNFNVLNPLNGCGNASSMSQDWTLHPTDVDLQTCMEVGGGIQAVRIDPQDGTVALVKLRLTLHGAMY